MKALVTGATGFIGGALACALSAAGWETHVLVRPESQHKLPPGEGWQVHLADLADMQTALLAAVQGMEVVFHAAAIRDRWGTSLQAYQQANVGGTRRLLEAARGRVGRFVYVSSVGVHGYPGVQGIDESFPLRPQDGKPGYHGAKAEGERLVFETLQGSSTQGVVVRPTITYGPGDRDGMVTRLLAMLARGRFLRVGPGKNHLHLTYIDDLVSGLFLAGVHPRAAGETFILAGPQSIPFARLVDLGCAALQERSVMQRDWLARLWLPAGPARLAAGLLEHGYHTFNRWMPAGREPARGAPFITRDQIDTICIHRGFSAQKAIERLGYQPQVPEPVGLARTVDWMVEQGRLPAAQVASFTSPAGSNKAD